MLELYHWEPNTFFLKALVTLKEARAEFTSRYFDPTTFAQFTPDFPRNVESALQLEREGPLLVKDGTVISSSFFLCEYVAEAFPQAGLLPAAAYDRYRTRAWGQYLALQLGPGVCALGCVKYLAPLLARRSKAELSAQLARIEPIERRNAWSALIDGSYDAAGIAAILERLKAPVKRIEEALGRSAWLAGASYSIADIDAYAMLSVLPDLAPELASAAATPRISKFLQTVGQRPAVREALAMSRTGKPHEAFVPGVEPSRWG
ncbi:MAG TPA: glutathione S-transferase [Steroidobacteraceae bacterium]|nr:glutathione S-transferase [Steroidobacteraceae bacterium]